MAGLIRNIIGSLFSRKSREELKIHLTFSNSVKLLKKFRKKLKLEKKDKQEEENDEKEIKEEAEILDFDEVVQGFEDFIKTFLDEEENFSDEIKKIIVVQYRMEEEIDDFLKKLRELSQYYNYAVMPQLVEAISKELTKIKNFIIQQRKIAHDFAFEHERRREKSILPYFIIYHKLRANAKKAKKDYKHLEKLFNHMEKIIDLLEKNKKDVNLQSPEGTELINEIKELQVLLKEEQELLMEEFKDLLLLQQLLEILHLRGQERFKELINMLNEIKNKEGFPESEYERLMREANDIWNKKVKELEQRELAEEKVLLKNIAA